jgi:hypothetical protein
VAGTSRAGLSSEVPFLLGLERAALALRHHADFGTGYGFLPILGLLDVWGHVEELQGKVVGILGVREGRFR